MKPNRQNIRKWVEALRSGDYRQATGNLTIKSGGERHCCLGVACVLAGVPGTLDADGRVAYGNLGERVTLPPEAREWLGVEDNNPIIAGYALSEWNDSKKADFNKIADMIEREYLTA